MTPSKRCEDFIKSFEKCRLSAYLPTPHDVPTIGWGSTGPDIQRLLRDDCSAEDRKAGSDLIVLWLIQRNDVQRALGLR